MTVRATQPVSTKGFYPYTLHCADRPWGVDSPRDFRDHFLAAFRAAKAEDKHLSWYAYDVVVHSRTQVTFRVHGMLDNVHGGVDPRVAYTLDATVPPEVTQPSITRRIHSWALDRRQQELDQQEAVIVRAYAGQLRRALSRADAKERA